MRYTVVWPTLLLCVLIAIVVPAAAQGDDDPLRIDQIVFSGGATVGSGKLAVTLGTQAIVYDLSDMEAKPRLYTMGNDYGHISLSADGELLSVPGDCNEINVVDVASGEVIAIVRADFPYCDPMQLAFSPDGRHAFFTDGRLFTVADLLAAGTCDLAVSSRLHPASPGRVAYSPSGTHLIFRDPTSTDVLVFDTREAALTARIGGYGGRYDRFALSADNLLLVALDNQEPTVVIDVASGEPVQSYWQDTEAAGIAAWLEGADGPLRLVHRGSGSSRPTYWRVFEVFDQTIDDVTPVTLPTANAVAGIFSADGSLLALVTEDNTIALHAGADGALIALLTPLRTTQAGGSPAG